jgi:peroxiredoxin
MEKKMTILEKNKMPEGVLMHMGSEGPTPISTSSLFDGKKVVIFSVPGAFTPTCSARHLPGFVENFEAFKEKGVDTLACMAVNDVFVMSAWGKSQEADEKIMMLADGNGDYSKALGLEMDGTGFGMGMRGKRFSIIVDDGVITNLNIEAPGKFELSSAEYTLSQL